MHHPSRGGTEPVPLRWMERKKGTTGKGQEGEREEGAKGGRPGGAGKELGVSKWGSGAKVPGRDSAGQAQPSSWDLPPTRPRNSLAHSLGRAGQGRAGRAGRAGLAWPAR